MWWCTSPTARTIGAAIVYGTRHVAEAAAAARVGPVDVSPTSSSPAVPPGLRRGRRTGPDHRLRPRQGRRRTRRDRSHARRGDHSHVAALRDRATHRRSRSTSRTDYAGGLSPMTFFSDEFRCPVHADDSWPQSSALWPTARIVGPLHVGMGRTCVTRRLRRGRLHGTPGLGDSPLPTTTIAESGMIRAANVVLDTSLAARLRDRVPPIPPARDALAA